MRGRKPSKFELKPKDETVLRKLLRDGQTLLKVARRAQILLNRGDENQRVSHLGEKVEHNVATVWRICERYRHGGLQAALDDAPRSGRPRVFSQKRPEAD